MSDMSEAMVQRAVDQFRKKTNGQVVLVLQGGGALGAYQVGVYQAPHEAGVEPDWIIDTSIGAINASIVAGNKPQDRLTKLDEFWNRMERPSAWPFMPAWTGISDAWSYWSTLATGIPGFFKPHVPAFWGAHIPLGMDRAGFYSTMSLRETLAESVDLSIRKGSRPRTEPDPNFEQRIDERLRPEAPAGGQIEILAELLAPPPGTPSTHRRDKGRTAHEYRVE